VQHLRAPIACRVAVVTSLSLCPKTVIKGTRRYRDEGFDSLYHRFRSGASAKFSVNQRCEVLAPAWDEPVNYDQLEGTTWTT